MFTPCLRLQRFTKYTIFEKINDREKKTYAQIQDSHLIDRLELSVECCVVLTANDLINFRTER